MLNEQVLAQGCYCCLLLNHQTRSGPCREVLCQAVASWLSWSPEGAVEVQLLVWLCPLGAPAPAGVQLSSCFLFKSSWHELGACHGGQRCPEGGPCSTGHPASPGHSCHQDPLGSCTWLSWLSFGWKRAFLGQIWQRWKGPGRWAAFMHGPALLDELCLLELFTALVDKHSGHWAVFHEHHALHVPAVIFQEHK